MSDIKESQSMAILDNTVKATNQISETENVAFDGDKNGSLKITVLGNSITRHAPKSEIGWLNDWGMAASALDKDYLHILMRRVREKISDTCFCITQVGLWEQNFYKEDIFSLYENCQRFNADIIIVRFGENVREDDCKENDFEFYLEKFLLKLSLNMSRKIIFTTSFWYNPSPNKAIRNLAKKYNMPLIELGHYGEMDEMKALGLFEHSGVAAHPGDLGMRIIADDIWNLLKDEIAGNKK